MFRYIPGTGPTRLATPIILSYICIRTKLALIPLGYCRWFNYALR
jgi:hypothetical protein